MSKTFVGTYTSTQTLSNPATDNPAVVTGTISVNSTSQYAVGLNGSSGFAWTVSNLGTVQSIGNQGIGIRLRSGGFITNGTNGSASALIKGSDLGVDVTGAAGTVTNLAVIQGI